MVTKDYTYAVTGDGEYALWDNTQEYQARNLVNNPPTLEIRTKLWNELRSWIERAETPYIDNWFENSATSEIQAWNHVHGLGASNNDRESGKRNVFDLSASKPKNRLR